MNKIYNAFLLAVLLTFSSVAIAQTEDVDAVTKVVEIKTAGSVNYSKINKELSDIEISLRNSQVDRDKSADYIKTLSATSKTIATYRKQLERELSFVQKRLEALGEIPKEGETEHELIAKNRQDFTSESLAIKAKIAEADIVLAKVDELENLILNTRNRALLDNLMEKQIVLINPATFLRITAMFVEFCFDIIQSPIDWYQGLNDIQTKEFRNDVLPFLILASLCLWGAIYLRVFIKHKLGYRLGVDKPSYSAKLFAAFSVAVGYGLIPASIIGAIILWIKNTSVMEVGFFGIMLKVALYHLLYIYLLFAIVRVVFARNHEQWRLFNIKTPKADKLTSAFYFTVTAIFVMSFFKVLSQIANYPPELIAYIKVFSNAIKAICIIMITHISLCDDCEKTQEPEEHEGSSEDEEMSLPTKITLLSSLFVIGTFGLSLVGYINLSSFILNRSILSFIVVAVLFMVSKILRDFLNYIISFKMWSKTLKISKRKMNKFDAWFDLVIDPMIIFFGIFILLGLWGVSTDLLLQSMKKILFGFSIGDVKISLISIFIGIAVFFIFLSVIRVIKNKLLNNILDKMEVDDAVKHSLSAGFGFFGVIVAALISIVVMGGSLSSLALVAGALSLGVGLGLQNVVNNFVSGIILLFERPIKVGDWVIINGQEGLVKQINIRATEVETWARASVIIPNADVLSTNVINLTLQDKWGRLEIKVGIAYGSDIEKVKRILLEIAAENKRVAKKPEPYVIFADFADSRLDFELRCFTSDVMNRLGISSELRTEINRRFIEEKIEIPFPQRVVHNVSQNSKYLDDLVEKP